MSVSAAMEEVATVRWNDVTRSSLPLPLTRSRTCSRSRVASTSPPFPLPHRCNHHPFSPSPDTSLISSRMSYPLCVSKGTIQLVRRLTPHGWSFCGGGVDSEGDDVGCPMDVMSDTVY